MQIIGRNIPQLQGEISSGFESIASGLQQSTQVQGLSAIDDVIESFSTVQVGTAGLSDLLPSVAGTAEFPNPSDYFQSNTQNDVQGFAPKEFQNVLKDQRFSPNTELEGVVRNELFDMLGKKPTYDLVQHGPYIAVPPPPDPKDLFGNLIWRQRMAHRAELLKQPFIPFENPPKQAEHLEDPKVDATSSESDASHHIGGTYFETIDNTVSKLNNNPAPETLQLFQQQLGVLKDMSSTVMQSVQMNQQLSSSLLATKIRV